MTYRLPTYTEFDTVATIVSIPITAEFITPDSIEELSLDIITGSLLPISDDILLPIFTTLLPPETIETDDVPIDKESFVTSNQDRVSLLLSLSDIRPIPTAFNTTALDDINK